MDSKNKKKLNLILNPAKTNITNTKSSHDSAPNSNKNQTFLNKSLSKKNFAEFLNFNTIFKDKEFSERKQTMNIFLKSDIKLTDDSKTSKSKIFFSDLKKNTSMHNYIMMKNLHQKSFTPLKKKGLMFTNELWSEKVYRKVVNNSDLKPKIDFLKLNQKIKLFHEIVHDLDSEFNKLEKFNKFNHSELINSIFQHKVNQSQENKGKQQENYIGNQGYLINNYQNLDQKIKQLTNLQTSENDSEKLKSIIEGKIGVCSVGDQKNLENLRVFRNRILSSLKEKKFNRNQTQFFHKSHTTYFRRNNSNLNKTFNNGNSEIIHSNLSKKPLHIGSNLDLNRKSQEKSNFLSIFNTKGNFKGKAMEVIKFCDEEKKANENLKK